jgi:hypothetical protein
MMDDGFMSIINSWDIAFRDCIVLLFRSHTNVGKDSGLLKEQRSFHVLVVIE